MANLFSSLLSPGEPTSAEHSSDVQPTTAEVSDDLELPEGADIPEPEILKQAIDKANQELETPVAARPVPATFDSSANIMKTATRDSDDTHHETFDDPNDDVMSLATDVNHHARALDDLRAAISRMSKQLEIIPSIDDRIRTLTTENDELKSSLTRVTTDLAQVRQSFNLYQSSTANKIADVERRAAEKQLRLDAPVVTDEVVPPSELVVIRDPQVSMNRQVDTLPSQPLSTGAKKKIAILTDF